MANEPTFECPIVQDAPDAVDNTCICFRHHGVECGFDFTNDTGGTIQAGNNIKLNCFNVNVTSPICNGDTGYADFVGGAQNAWRMYLPRVDADGAPLPGLAADICLGDAVVHPVTGAHLGYAVGRLYGKDRVPGLMSNNIVSAAGDYCVYYVSMHAEKTG